MITLKIHPKKKKIGHSKKGSEYLKKMFFLYFKIKVFNNFR